MPPSRIGNFEIAGTDREPNAAALNPRLPTMSTIASPREPPRRNLSQQNLATPTSSTRPSLDVPRSATGSPNPNANAFSPGSNAGGGAINNKKNRAALREYYNLRNKPATPSVEVTDPLGDQHEASEVPPSVMDKEGFDADAYVKKALTENGMEDLLRLYTRTLGEIRALDAEKKALVYDNYSKLIAATETIRKVCSSTWRFWTHECR